MIENNLIDPSAVRVEIIPLRDNVLEGVTNRLQLLIKIVTAPAVLGAKKNFDLSTVLDRSGSMSGNPIKMAKRAIRKIIKHTSEGDHLHFITYSTNVEVVFEDGNLNQKDKLVEQVKLVSATGNTNLSEGLQKGFEILHKYKSLNTGNAGRIFLFSDGMANEGIVEKQALWKIAANYVANGIKVSTFGIGREFDEVLMKGIAQHGNGDYFFIDTANNIPKLVSKAIHGVMNISASDANIKLRGTNGLLVKKVYGKEDVDLVQALKIGDLLSGNTKNLLVEVEVNCTNSLNKPTFVWELTYQIGEVQYLTRLNGSLVLNPTTDESTLQNAHHEVLVALKIKEASQVDSNVAKLIAQGKIPDAINTKEAMLQDLRNVVQYDPTGNVAKLIKKGEEALVELQNKKDLPMAYKKFHNLHHMADADDDFAYASGDDSDEGNYSASGQEDDDCCSGDDDDCGSGGDDDSK